MMRDINPSGTSPDSKLSSTKHQAFIGEQPKKLCDRNGKSFTKHKKTYSSSALHDMDDLSRGRHIYHRAATKNVTREILRTSQF